MKTILFLMLALGLHAEEVNVTLTWAANPEQDVAYYNLKVGTQAGVYPTIVPVPAVQVTVPLPKDTMHYAVVTAVNTSGLESAPSAQLVFQVFRAGEGKVPSAPVELKKPMALQLSIEMSKDDMATWKIVTTKAVNTTEPRVQFRTTVKERALP